MMSNRLGGVVQQAVAAAVLGAREQAGGRAPSRELHTAEGGGPEATEAERRRRRHVGGGSGGAAAAAPWLPPPSRSWLSPATPAGGASAFLRCLDAQLQARKYMSGGDEAGDVLGSFPSASLFYYPGGGLQGVVEHVAAAAAEARGAASPAAASVLRSLAGAVGRLAVQPHAETARGKAAAVITCLDGMAEALEGACKGPTTSPAAPPSAAPGGGLVGAPSASAAAALPSSEDAEAASAVVGLEAGALLREVAAVLDCIAGGSPGLASAPHPPEGGHTVSPSAPVHPLLSALETRLYADSTWRSDSAAEIACGLVDLLAALCAPSRLGNTCAPASAVARGAACAALHSLARAQGGLVEALREHRAEPAVASRLLLALAEALAAACITRDAAEPARGPPPRTCFGEAQLLVGLSRMAAGEAIAEATTPGGAAAAADAAAAAMVADAAAGDASSDAAVAVSDTSLVLEVMAAEAAEVAATHCDHIAQVLQDLREVPPSLAALSELPPAAAAVAPAAGDLLRRATAIGGAAAAAEAAASVAAANLAAFTEEPRRPSPSPSPSDWPSHRPSASSGGAQRVRGAEGGGARGGPVGNV
ncbi:hypothetical protein PLESTM_000484900 [Pleodorina starrii]|nr:hypothetical protein PLESTM_000484900 [Pleodorina starrii]